MGSVAGRIDYLTAAEPSKGVLFCRAARDATSPLISGAVAGNGAAQLEVDDDLAIGDATLIQGDPVGADLGFQAARFAQAPPGA